MSNVGSLGRDAIRRIVKLEAQIVQFKKLDDKDKRLAVARRRELKRTREGFRACEAERDELREQLRWFIGDAGAWLGNTEAMERLDEDAVKRALGFEPE